MKTALSFDDVLLVPQYSSIVSRREIDLSSRLEDGNVFRLPIIASPMDTISGWEMAAAMRKLGGFAVIHRYNKIEEQAGLVTQTVIGEDSPVAAAIGMSDDYLERAYELYKAGARILCVDVAHGHHSMMKSAIESLRMRWDENIHIMAGNVATAKAYCDLSNWGADSIRVGIGCGSICSTRIQTGHGVPVLQSLFDIGEAKLSAPLRPSGKPAAIICDGGIRNGGDIVKALAAGADFVMCGSLFAGATETPGRIFIDGSGRQVKKYRGMSSREAQMDWKESSNSPEGIETTVPMRGKVKNIIEELEGGIRSGLSYSGALTIKQLRQKAVWVRQTGAGQIESSTHILNKNA